MPNVKRIRLPQYDTVDRALHRGVVDLLPSHLGENLLVRWVVAFDATLKARGKESDDSLYFRKNRERWTGALLGRMGSALLQSRIPFYFASVFHIGRMMVISAESLERIGALKQSPNLDTSVAKIADTFLTQKSVPQNLASTDLVRLALLDCCDRATSRQSQQADLADRWWKHWQLEVGELRDAMEEIEKGWHDCHESEAPWRMADGVFRLWQSTATDSLQSEMARSGVQFKNLESSTMGTAGKLVESNPILLVAALGLFGGRHRHQEPWFHVEHLVKRWLDVERAKAEADLRRVDHEKSEIALRLLQQKYVGANPFDQFAVGLAAATSRLRDLVKEHSLPNGSPSPWRQVWQEQLLVIYSYDRPLVGSGGNDDDLRKWCFLTADSAIKNSIDKSGAQHLPWKVFVQRLFEREWLVEIAKMARNANRPLQSKAWTTASVSELVSHAVEDLNQIGYQLEVPDSNRIDSLLKKLEKGEAVYDSTDW